MGGVSPPSGPDAEAIRLHYREVRTVLRKAPSVDSWFVGKFAFSPYQACAHGCLYCDGRAERYYVDGEFDRDIVVRRNVAEVLSAELARRRERGIVFIGSGISDAYQPPEREEELMRSCAQALAGHRVPATVLTRSALIRRDLDLWAEVNRKAGFTLMVSLALTDERIRRAFEPRAGTIEERLATLRAFRSAGCAVGVAAMPLLPHLTDSTEALGTLADALAAIPVDFVLPGGLTLRPGRQKDTFLAALERHFPDLLPLYRELYSENRPSGSPRSAYLRGLTRRAEAVFDERGLPTLMPHRLFQGRLSAYDEVQVLLRHMITLYKKRRRPVARLEEAAAACETWLTARKQAFSRSRRLTGTDLEEELRARASRGELERILHNGRLAAFLSAVLLEGKTLDYRLLELVEGGVAGGG